MRIIFVLMLVFLVASGASDALAKSDGYVTVDIEYRSASGDLQIRDNVCKDMRNIDCEKARITLQGENCNREKRPDYCKEAEELLSSSFCVPGLVFDGRVAAGEKIQVRVCESYSGFGNLSVRDTRKTSIWTTYMLLTDGDEITYP